MGKLLLMALSLLLSINLGDIKDTYLNKDIEEDIIDINYDYSYKLEKEKQSDAMILTLSGNPTTGYNWVYEENYKGDLVSIDKPVYIQDDYAYAMMIDGRGGNYTFRIVPNKNSKDQKAELKFRYIRPWESNNGIARAALVVTKDNSGNINYDFIKDTKNEIK